MHATLATHQLFPFLLGRAFIEANGAKAGPLSIRPGISLPFREGFH